VDGELGLVGSEAKGQPGRVSHREGLVELGREGIKVGREGRSGSGRVGDEQGDGPSIVDFSGDSEGEDTVRISEDTGADVGGGGSNQGSLRVLGGGGTGSVESSLGGWERLWSLGDGDGVAG